MSKKYTCVVDTTYTLSLYLLMQSDEVIKDTVFFVGSAIPESVSSMLPAVIRMDNRKGTYNTALKLLKSRIEAKIKWRFRHKTLMYAQDHLAYSAHIIDKNKYILLEDAPRIYTNYKTINFMKPIVPMSLKSKITSWLYWGGIGRKRLGTNKQCIDRIVTTVEDLNSDLILNKKFTYVNLKELWNSSSSKKKSYIMKMFDVTDEILELPKKCSVILFSQPFLTDCKMSEQEISEIYRPYIERDIDTGIVIKPHPRDRYDYKKHFPGVEILNSKAPMQLLSAMGVEFKKAITVCSSAVSALPDNTEIVWIGAKINPKILKVYGDLKCPR